MAAVAALLCVCFSAHTACPDGAGPQCSLTLASGVYSPRRIAVSPDDTLAAVAAYGGSWQVYTVITGAALTVPYYIDVYDVEFSPDGNTVVVAAVTDGVAVVSLSSGTELWSTTAKRHCHTVAYTRDGTRVASGHDDGSIYIWDSVTGALVLSLTGAHQSSVLSLKYTIDGTKLISGSADGVVVWDAMSGNSLKVLTDHAQDVQAIDVSPDGLLFATAARTASETVNIYRLSDYSTERKLTPGRDIFTLSFHSDSRKLLGAGQGDLEVYAVASGSLLESYTTPVPDANTLAASYFHNQDTFITAGYYLYADILLWNYVPPPPPTPAPPTPYPPTTSPATPSPPTPAPPTPAPVTPFPPTATPGTPTPETSVSQSCEIPDTFASVCGAGTSHRCVLRIQHTGSVLSVAHSADGSEVAAGGSDGKVRVFSAATGAQLRSLVCGGFAAHDVAFSPDGARVAVGGAGGRAVVCDATTGAVLLELEHGDAAAGPVRRVRFSPDGLHLVVGGVEEEVTRVHDAVAGMRAELVLHRHSREVAFVPAASGSGAAARVAAVTVYAEAGEAVRVLAVDNGQQEAAVVSVGARVTPLSFSPNGDELARGMDDGTVRVGLWAGAGTSGSDASTSERLRLQHGSGIVFDVQHSPDGRLVAAAGAGPVVVWGTSGGAAVAELVGHAGAVRRLSFSPDGTRVATAGHDGQLFVWDMTGL